jgi:ribosomal protein S18 acetylase RimI-like enzyme
MTRKRPGARIRIRPCRTADVSAVLDLWKRARAAPGITDRPDAIRRRLKRDRQLFLLAWEGRRLVGSIMAGWDGWRASMARLAVDPEYRRLGVARLLVARAEKQLRAAGAERIGGVVLRSNQAGRRFWSTAGYLPERGVMRYVKNLR